MDGWWIPEIGDKITGLFLRVRKEGLRFEPVQKQQFSYQHSRNLARAPDEPTCRVVIPDKSFGDAISDR